MSAPPSPHAPTPILPLQADVGGRQTRLCFWREDIFPIWKIFVTHNCLKNKNAQTTQNKSTGNSHPYGLAQASIFIKFERLELIICTAINSFYDVVNLIF